MSVTVGKKQKTMHLAQRIFEALWLCQPRYVYSLVQRDCILNLYINCLHFIDFQYFYPFNKPQILILIDSSAFGAPVDFIFYFILYLIFQVNATRMFE